MKREYSRKLKQGTSEQWSEVIASLREAERVLSRTMEQLRGITTLKEQDKVMKLRYRVQDYRIRTEIKLGNLQ